MSEPQPNVVLESPDEQIDPSELARVEELVRTLGKTVRAYQLYEGSSPVYDRFVELLRRAFHAYWEGAQALALEVQESRIFWRREEVYHSDQRSENIAFLFHRDGIRQLVFHPGFEESELEIFLSLLARVHRARDDQDDLVTLLWEQDFAHFAYRNVDFAVDGMEIPLHSGSDPRPLETSDLRRELEQVDPVSAARGALAEREATAVELPVSFQDTLYFLEEGELRLVRSELQRELGRPLLRDVLNGLFDRLEDGAAERQRRIVRILTDLLPGLISGGRISEASLLLREMAALVDRETPPTREVLVDIRSLFEQLAEPATIRELLRTVEDAPEAIDADEFATLLGYFPPRALAPLIAAAEAAERPEVRRTIGTVIERLAAHDPRQVARLLTEADPVLAAGAARLVGRLGVTDAAPDVGRLLQRPEAQVRLAAIEALQALRVSSAAGALPDVLGDENRDVRIAAARALGAMRYTPARPQLEARLATRAVREADVTERIAVFEAYGSVAGAEGVPLLARLLNSRSWLGRREAPEIRACAALALGRTGQPAAREALEQAARDSDPVVRTAVLRSLRQEAR